jgi:hypothetical protein
MSVFVVRAFVRLRELLGAHKQLAVKIEELERKLATHDHSIHQLLEAIRQLIPATVRAKPKRIGFQPKPIDAPRTLKAAAGKAR